MTARSIAALLATAALGACAAPGVPPAGQRAAFTPSLGPGEPDPFSWTEEVQGTRALAAVEGWNDMTRAALEATPNFAANRARALDLLQDDAQIAAPSDVGGGMVFNFWTDGENPRGLWRVTGLDDYLAGKRDWRVLIDVGSLGTREGKSWVWHGADCLTPEYRRCLVSLSEGGTDADVVREFDVASGRFVAGGFTVPQAKSNVSWLDADTLLVATDYGPDTLTRSGYPRIVKRWRRGTPLASATTVLEGQESDVSVGGQVSVDGGRRWPVVTRALDFYTTAAFHLTPNGTVPVPLPRDAELAGVVDGQMLAHLYSDMGDAKAGSVVAYDIATVLAGGRATVQTVFTPGASQSVEEVRAGDGVVWIKLLDDVSGKLIALTPGNGGWTRRDIALPDQLTLSLGATADERGLVFATAEGFLVPPTLYAVGLNAAPQALQTLPARFDTAAMTSEQRFATSKDGTRVPYFLVRPKGAAGPTPALIHAYGGFRAAQTPTVLTQQPYRAGPTAQFWVEEGNAYVLANIRGGGEYGPAWHAAALREKRQNAYDDFHAVAEDLIRTGVTTAGKIAASGRSNGGLLVGVLMEQRPDLYGAIVMGSPLADMARYTHLLAGASWAGEYGDPDVPADWAFISRYSPYQNLRPDVRYPAPFIYTSTLDDRVHPAHARKMAARMAEQGHPFYYFEATEGGHAAGADKRADAYRAAMILAYLNKEIGGL